VTITKLDKSSLEVKFEALILCTGLEYSSPWRDTKNLEGLPSSYAERLL